MSYTTILARIKTLCQTVAGVVRDYEIVADDENTFIGLLRAESGAIDCVTISRGSCPSDEADMVRFNHRRHQFNIKYFYGISSNGSSEPAFQAKLEALQNAFDADPQLNGTVLKADALQIPKIQNQQFGQTLVCHYAECEFEAIERVSRV